MGRDEVSYASDFTSVKPMILQNRSDLPVVLILQRWSVFKPPGDAWLSPGLQASSDKQAGLEGIYDREQCRERADEQREFMTHRPYSS
jgi:hypothetical protein